MPNSRLVLAIGLLLSTLASPGLADAKRTSPTPAKTPSSADTRLREIYTAEWKWRSHEESDSEDDVDPFRGCLHLPFQRRAEQAVRPGEERRNDLRLRRKHRDDPGDDDE